MKSIDIMCSVFTKINLLGKYFELEILKTLYNNDLPLILLYNNYLLWLKSGLVAYMLVVNY